MLDQIYDLESSEVKALISELMRSENWLEKKKALEKMKR